MAKDRKYYITWLIIITVLGCALRVYRLNEIPFTYDELSALFRTHYTGLHDLIHLGVAGDGHPAGVQVFLFYWTKLFGETEWLVKLPFIIMGILCIPLIYRIGARWFSRDTAIISACMVAGLQYTVMYSQIARPYISGLFLVLLLVVIWNELILKATYRNLLCFAVVLALCAYNHYFSLLTAGCVVATGFFVIHRRYLPKYILAIAVSITLFIPHIHLFLGHLKLKGLEWISAPTPDFFANYFYYVFNFSNLILLSILLLLLQGIYLAGREINPTKLKYRVIALLWFVIPAAVGYFYSVYRAPVLQNSVLIFSFPFLILFVCSFITLPSSHLKSIEIGTLLFVLVFSLGWERSYYKIFYHAETEMFARHISGYETAYGNNVAAVVKTNPVYLDYYKKKYNTGWSYQDFDSLRDIMAFKKFLIRCDKRYLILGNIPQEWGPQYLTIAKGYYPCVDSIYYGFTTDIYILRKDNLDCKQNRVLRNYSQGDSIVTSEKHQLKAYLQGSEKVYKSCDSINNVVLFSSDITAMQLSENEKLDISIEVNADSFFIDEGWLTLRFMANNHLLQQRTTRLECCHLGYWEERWQTNFLTARLYHSPIKDATRMEVSLTAKSAGCIEFKNFKIEVVPDNPVLYSLIKK